MKRYYMDRLNVFESFLKAVIVNILITIFLGLIFIVTGLYFDMLYIYVFFILYVIIIIYHILKSYSKISFYINDNSIIYCKGNKEAKIKLHSITKLEEYFGINYLFGKKTIFIYVNNKKYDFVIKKSRADIFKNQLEEYINETEEFGDFKI
ncbi:MAG: hypothetical protein WC006_06180 [Bacilli bacterium]